MESTIKAMKLVTAVLAMATVLLVSRASCDENIVAPNAPDSDVEMCYKVCKATCANRIISPANCIPTCRRQCDVSVSDVVSDIFGHLVPRAEPEPKDAETGRAIAATLPPVSDEEN